MLPARPQAAQRQPSPQDLACVVGGRHARPAHPRWQLPDRRVRACSTTRTPAAAAAAGGGNSSGGSGGGGSSSNRRPTTQGDSSSDGDAARHPRHPLLQLLLSGLLPGWLCQLLLPLPALAGGRAGLVSRRDESSALPQWEIDAFVDKLWELSGPIVNNMGFSGLLGAAAAAALKFVGRTLAASVGMCLVLVQVLSYYGAISVNWSVVHEQARSVLDRTGDGRLDKDDFKRAVKKWMIVLSEGVPSVSGFLLGFLVGMRLF